jgi:hypothetical protein
MKKIFKKIFLNGLIRTVLSLFYSILFKIQSFKIPESLLSSKKLDQIEISIASKQSTFNYHDSNDKDSSFSDEDEIERCSDKNLSHESDSSDKESSIKSGLTKVNQNTYEYKNEYDQYVRLDTKCLKAVENVNISTTSSGSKSKSILYFLKNKNFNMTKVIICVCVFIVYVSLNNYLIVFSYKKTTESESFEVDSYFKESDAYTDNSLNFSYHQSFFNSILSTFDRFVSVVLYDLKNDMISKNASTFTNSSLKILIDPQDLDVAGLTIDQNDINRIILTDQYFDEEFNSYTNETRQNKSTKLKVVRPCVLAKLNPYEKEIMQFVQKETLLKCNPKQNWVFIENGKNFFNI